MKHLLEWFEQIDTCRSFDQLRPVWQQSLEQHRLGSGWGEHRLADAVLFFLGHSALTASDKLGIVLSFVGTIDFDTRLAVGLLDQCEWDPDDAPEPVGTPVPMPDDSGHCLALASNDAWLLGFLNGRLSEVRTRMAGEHDEWRQKFWQEFLYMASRQGDIASLDLALSKGASIGDSHWHAVALASSADSDQWRVFLDALLDRLTFSDEMAAVALGSAAAAERLDVLEHLVMRGADLPAALSEALTEAARNGCLGALNWLLEHGAKPRTNDGAAILAAISSLSEDAVLKLLNAGASLHGIGTTALATALTSMPYDLYAGDCHDFIEQRKQMLILLLGQGITVDADQLCRAVEVSADLHAMLYELLASEDFNQETLTLLETLLASTSNAGDKRC